MTTVLKDQVAYVLENYPETRDSDIKLTLRIWRSFYEELLIPGGEYSDAAVSLRDIPKLPREDNVKRYRAYFQNDPVNPRWLPTREDVAAARRMNIEAWRSALGYENLSDTL